MHLGFFVFHRSFSSDSTHPWNRFADRATEGEVNSESVVTRTLLLCQSFGTAARKITLMFELLEVMQATCGDGGLLL